MVLYDRGKVDRIKVGLELLGILEAVQALEGVKFLIDTDVKIDFHVKTVYLVEKDQQAARLPSGQQGALSPQHLRLFHLFQPVKKGSFHGGKVTI